MAETSRRTFFKSAAVVAVGATAGLPGANAQTTSLAQTTSPAPDYLTFVRLSSTLTGMTEKELPALIGERNAVGSRVKLYEIYWERLHAAYPAEFGELLAAWRVIQDRPDSEAALAEKLAAPGAASTRLRMAARQVIKIWYLSTIDDPRTALDAKGINNGQLGGDLGQYQQSAIWKLIGAPPTGYSNSTHGYWANKPA